MHGTPVSYYYSDRRNEKKKKVVDGNPLMQGYVKAVLLDNSPFFGWKILFRDFGGKCKKKWIGNSIKKIFCNRRFLLSDLLKELTSIATYNSRPPLLKPVATYNKHKLPYAWSIKTKNDR